MAEQTVILQPGESEVVTFEAIPHEVKTFQVTVDGLSGSFRVEELPETVSIWNWLTGGIQHRTYGSIDAPLEVIFTKVMPYLERVEYIYDPITGESRDLHVGDIIRTGWLLRITTSLIERVIWPYAM